MTEWMQLISTLLGGVVGAVLAWFGATLKAKDSLRNDDLKWGRERVLFIESLYSEMIAAISQMINNAVNRTSNADVGYELISAKIELHANQEVIKAFHAWHDAYHEWVDNYLAGQPQKIGETGLAMLSSNQSGYSDKAKELYPKLHEAGGRLITACRGHIEQILNKEPNKVVHRTP